VDVGVVVFVVMVVLVAGVAQSVTGFGFALVAVPPLIAVLEPADAIVMISLLALVNSALVLHQTAAAVPWRSVTLMFACSAAAMPAGLVVLLVAPSDALRIAVGVTSVVMAAALVSGLRIGGNGTTGGVIAGATSGVLLTSTGMNGPPVVLHLTDQQLPPAEFRGALSAFFLASGLLSLVVFAIGGVVSERALLYSAVGAPAVLIASQAGRALVDRVDQRTFRFLVLALLAVTASIAVTTSAARLVT